MYSTAQPRDYPACSGCSLCRLVCPMWRQRRDPRFSPEGIAKARQHGATVTELAEVLDACTLCGGCDPVCPEAIALTGMIMELRRELEVPPDLQVLQVGYEQAAAQAAAAPAGALLLPGAALRADHAPHYEMSCVPPGAEGWAYGCEFEPMIEGEVYSRDHFQSFKNAIYDIGVDMGASYYRFGGMMKGYIRRVFGDALVDRHLAMKREADPAMILNRDVIF